MSRAIQLRVKIEDTRQQYSRNSMTIIPDADYNITHILRRRHREAVMSRYGGIRR